MCLCPICRVNKANKKNVHLIPWFLIKTIITQEGTGERDKELSFTIDPNLFTTLYTGRSVLPETIEEYKDLNELQIEKNNPHARDYLICSKCEDKISRLEAIFAMRLNENSLRNKTKEDLVEFLSHQVYFDLNYNQELFQLLILSIFYRCSIGKYSGFSLNPSIQNKIEDCLRNVFQSPESVKIQPNQAIELKCKFPVLISFQTSHNDHPTKQYITIVHNRFPYALLIGKWTFQLYEAEKHLTNPSQWLFGEMYYLNPKSAYAVVKEKSHVILLSKDSSDVIYKNVLNFFVDKKIIGIKKKIRELHKYLMGFKPDAYIVDYILNKYVEYSKEGKTEFDSMAHAFMELKNL